MNLRFFAASLAIAIASVVAWAQEFPVAPYADPAQLDCPWPKHSFYKQPWRGYLETRPANEFLQGIGINYHSTGNDELAIRLLAETGIRTARLEVGFGSMNWDETGLNGEKKIRSILELFKKHNIRPTLLLNAHHGVPCPVKFFKRNAMADAAVGAKSIVLDDVSALVIGHSGVNSQKDYWAAAHLVTAIDAGKKEIQLSRPLSKEIKAGESINMATLKFAPLHPVGTPEFEATAKGWVKYAMLYCQAAAESGFADGQFDIELWNELSFGSNYTQVKNYYAKDDPAAPKGKDFLNPGGCCWEMAKRTVEVVKAKYPAVRAIWGFSNTTFYHCAIEKLPPGVEGQSYHPYGTGTPKLPDAETHKDRPELNLERFTPTIDIKMPEGWAHTFIQTECLIRHLRPDQRTTKMPPGVKQFHHYMTEHGIVPAECGVNDEEGAWRLKSLCATRSFLMWMNKGVDVMHYFQAVGKDWKDMGILPVNIKTLPADAKWEEVATPPMRAIRRMVGAFKGAAPITSPRALSMELTALGEQRKIFEGDATHPPLWEREVVAMLPWQVSDNQFAIAAYVMSYDATKALPDSPYRIIVKGMNKPKYVVGIDVVTGKSVPLRANRMIPGGVELELMLTESPKILVFRE